MLSHRGTASLACRALLVLEWRPERPPCPPALPNGTCRYWDDDDATAAAQLPGGWLRTGDLGCLSQGERLRSREQQQISCVPASSAAHGLTPLPFTPVHPLAGRLWLLGRAKDMIKSGGENVHAWEVERCLAAHPAVAMAAVVGAADWRLGEAVAAAVVLRPGWRWRGERCQVLLAAHGQAAGQAAARSTLAAAAAAVTPSGSSGSGLGGGVSEGGDGSGGSEARQAAGFAEDWRSTLLQGSSSPPGSSLEHACSGNGGLLAAAASLEEQQERRPHPGALQQLAAVAAGLQAAAQAADAGTSSGSRSSSGSGGGRDAEGQSIDGPALQQHCRAAGLAGFKLPRVFLLCHAAGTTGGSGRVGSGREVLPLNSTGKVVKHLLRERIQLHMQAAAKAAGSSGSGPRSRL